MFEDDTPEEEEHRISLSFNLSLDREGFLRQTCPSCGLDFKVDTEEAEHAWRLAAYIAQIAPEEVPDPDAPEPEPLFCPYCGLSSSPQSMHTRHTVEYIQRLVYRDYMLPALNPLLEAMTELGRASRGGPLEIRCDLEELSRPPRPFHGPEPPDLTTVHFLCCNRCAKIHEAWLAPPQCVYCGTLCQPG